MKLWPTPRQTSLYQADFTFHASDLDAATETVRWTMDVLHVRAAMRIEYIRLWAGDRGRPRRDADAETITVQNDAGRHCVHGRQRVPNPDNDPRAGA